MSQLKFIRDILLEHKEISRNFCLKHYITRLGARINDLKKEGMIFRTERKNGDFIYHLLEEKKEFEQAMAEWEHENLHKRMEKQNVY